MKWTLYTADQSRGFMVEWLLEELGVSFERRLVNLFSGETKSEAYRSIHPLGSLPALVGEGEPMMESQAMVLLLADSEPESALAPVLTSPHRAAYLQWVVYGTATLEPALGPTFVRSLSGPPGEREKTATREEIEGIHRVLEPLSDALERGSMLPTGFSAADVVIGSELVWAEDVGLLARHPEARAYLADLKTRPAFVACKFREKPWMGM
jgi:glutathione S-transferase